MKPLLHLKEREGWVSSKVVKDSWSWKTHCVWHGDNGSVRANCKRTDKASTVWLVHRKKGEKRIREQEFPSVVDVCNSFHSSVASTRHTGSNIPCVLFVVFVVCCCPPLHQKSCFLNQQQWWHEVSQIPRWDEFMHVSYSKLKGKQIKKNKNKKKNLMRYLRQLLTFDNISLSIYVWFLIFLLSTTLAEPLVTFHNQVQAVELSRQ